jgi:excisionase family DNA binding protein
MQGNTLDTTTDPPAQPRAVSPRKAARYLDVGDDAIYQLLGQGRLRSVKLGRRRLIPLTELKRFLAEGLV